MFVALHLTNQEYIVTRFRFLILIRFAQDFFGDVHVARVPGMRGIEFRIQV